MRCRQWKLDKLILSIVRAKDGYTAIHSQNVARLAEAIGRELDLRVQINTDLKLAGLLHDIGKLHISRQVLNKPGELGLNERAWIRSHPFIGARLAELAGCTEEVVKAILCHHERLDGSGYPNRLQEPELSYISQIVGVADVYDAMTSDRPYRMARPTDEAIDFLTLEDSFNQDIVQALQDALKSDRTWR